MIVFDELKTPEKLVNFIRENFAWDNLLHKVKPEEWGPLLERRSKYGVMPGWLLSPLWKILESKKANCYEIALFAAYALIRRGYKADLLHIGFEPPENAGWADNVMAHHGVCLYSLGKNHYVIFSFMNDHSTQHFGPFKNIREIIAFLEKYKGRKVIEADYYPIDYPLYKLKNRTIQVKL